MLQQKRSCYALARKVARTLQQRPRFIFIPTAGIMQADAQNDEEQGQLARKVARTLPRQPRTVIYYWKCKT